MYIICYLPLFPTQASAINTVIVINIINVDSITTILQTLCLYILSSTSPAGYPGNKKKAVIHYLVNRCHKSQQICPLVERNSRSFPDSWLITWFVTRVTRRVPHVEQELLTFPVHMSSPPVLVSFVLLNL